MRNIYAEGENMMTKTSSTQLKDGDQCEVVKGTHTGKSGTVRDIKTSKTGEVTITVVQADGERFKTLARNVVVKRRSNS
jgi:ribosomal protein S4E